MSRFPPEFLAKIREALLIAKEVERIASIHKDSMAYSFAEGVRQDLENMENRELHNKWIDNGRKSNITALEERFNAIYGVKKRI